MKFIHSADLHLDSPFEGLKQLPDEVWQRVYRSPFLALTKLVDIAIENQIDFVLLAGDLYDQDTQSVAAQLSLKDQLQRLLDHQIAVYLSYGNHDYHPAESASIGIPADVVQFGPAVTTQTLITRDQKRVAISGFSYDQRWLEDDQVPKFPERQNEDYHIGMLHGSVKQGKDSDHYAPFELSELVAKHYDYWALGHIHKPQLLAETPPIVYAGTIQGRHKNEAGPHGFDMVSDETGRLQPTFIPVSPIDWVTLTVSAESTDDDASLIDRIMSQMSQQQSDRFQLSSLIIDNVEVLSPDLLQRLLDGTWQGQLDHEQQRQVATGNAWIYEVTPKPTAPKIEYSELDERFWQAASQNVFTASNLQLTAGKLMQTPFLAAHFAASEVQEQITNRAESLLVQESRQEAAERED